jgi:hypothetical protein
VLNQVDLKTRSVDLSDLEKQLQWSEVANTPPGAEKARSALDEFVRLFGVTS